MTTEEPITIMTSRRDFAWLMAAGLGASLAPAHARPQREGSHEALALTPRPRWTQAGLEVDLTISNTGSTPVTILESQSHVTGPELWMARSDSGEPEVQVQLIPPSGLVVPRSMVIEWRKLEPGASWSVGTYQMDRPKEGWPPTFWLFAQVQTEHGGQETKLQIDAPSS